MSTFRSIVIIGDSQAEGLAEPLRAELARRGVGPVTGTATISGVTTRVLLDRRKPQALVAFANPDLVIVALGGNDTAGGSYPRTLEEFVRALARPNGELPEIVWIGPAFSEDAEVDARHELVSQVQAHVLPSLGVRWYNSRGWTENGPAGVHAGDGTHFTANAYAYQAVEVVRRVQSRFPVAAVIGGGLAVAGVGVLGLIGLIWSRR